MTTAINQMLESGTLKQPDFNLSFYHKYDLVKQVCEYMAAYGYANKPDDPTSDNLISGQVPSHPGLKVGHLGTYLHLGNAWTMAMSCQGSMKLKVSKQIPMYEVYISMPGEVGDAELKTEIYLPINL